MLLKYFKGKRNLELTLIDDQVVLKTWYLNASLAVHEDCKRYTVTLMTFGHGGHKFLIN